MSYVGLEGMYTSMPVVLLDIPDGLLEFSGPEKYFADTLYRYELADVPDKETERIISDYVAENNNVLGRNDASVMHGIITVVYKIHNKDDFESSGHSGVLMFSRLPGKRRLLTGEQYAELLEGEQYTLNVKSRVSKSRINPIWTFWDFVVGNPEFDTGEPKSSHGVPPEQWEKINDGCEIKDTVAEMIAHNLNNYQQLIRKDHTNLNEQLKDYEPDTPRPTIHNIVATSQISSKMTHINLDMIHRSFPSFAFYDKFAAITLRLHSPECTTLLFSSGKLVVTGCKTWYECVYASLFVAKLLENTIPGVEFRLTACDVQNIVAHVELPVNGGSLDIRGMYARMPLNCTFQHRLFPGLIYRHDHSPVVLLCFTSGKVVITGGKTMDDVFSGWNNLWPTLRSFIVAGEKPASHDDDHVVDQDVVGGSVVCP